MSQRFKAGYALLRCLFSTSLGRSLVESFSALLFHPRTTIRPAQSQAQGPLPGFFYRAQRFWDMFGPFGIALLTPILKSN